MSHLIPYCQYPKIIQSQIAALSASYPSISPSPDSTTSILLLGSVPLASHSLQIPLHIQVPFQYPHSPPTLSIPPTPNLTIKQTKVVDIHGRIYHPLLAYWTSQTTLLQLIDAILIELAINPPLSSTTIDTSLANAALALQVQALIESQVSVLQPQLSSEIDALIREKSRVVQGIQTVERMCGELARHDSQLSRLLAGVSEAIGKVERDIEAIEARAPLDALTLVKGERPVDEQLFGLLADDMATDDVLYHTEKALLAGVIDLSGFIKHVRILAREQYKTRALIIKIQLNYMF